MVDLLLLAQYRDVDLCQSPCIVPPCGHILTMESIDGQMEMSRFFQTNQEGEFIGLQALPPAFSMKDIKVCSTCRGSLRSVSRYGHVVRRALIDESTKKFILWANKEYLKLRETLLFHQTQLTKSSAAAPKTAAVQRDVQGDLVGVSSSQIEMITKSCKDARYESALHFRRKTEKYLRNVSHEEQPFCRVWEVVQYARRQKRTDSNMSLDTDILQTSQSLKATALLLRCDLVILSDFLEVYGRHVQKVSLKANKESCEELRAAACDSRQPAIQTEACLFLAQFALAERTRAPAEEKTALTNEACEFVEQAKDLHKEYPGQMRHLAAEITSVEKMLLSSTFTSVVTDEEWKEVMAAMASEFRGTGHWYRCENGHPFTIGECGMPMQLARCPQCNAPIGGTSHRAVEGVQQAGDLEERFGRLGL